MLHTLVRWLLIGSVALFIFSFWHRNDLPQPAQLPPQLSQAPIQIQVNQPVIDKEVGGISYHIQPLYQYELYGLVVSQHDATSWQDYLHQQWNDKLNISDVCVLWGNNAIKGVYQEFKFWNGQFTCNFLTRSTPAFQAFDQTAISNNHLLTASPELMKKIASIKIGDSIHVRGYLASYSHNQGFAFQRGTSTTRSDTGNGACETIYLEDIDIIQRSPVPYRLLMWLAVVACIVSFIAWMALPFKP